MLWCHLQISKHESCTNINCLLYFFPLSLLFFLFVSVVFCIQIYCLYCLYFFLLAFIHIHNSYSAALYFALLNGVMSNLVNRNRGLEKFAAALIQFCPPASLCPGHWRQKTVSLRDLSAARPRSSPMKRHLQVPSVADYLLNYLVNTSFVTCKCRKHCCSLDIQWFVT